MVWSYRKNQRNKNGQSIHSWKPISKRPTGRPKICWEDDVKKDMQRLKVPNWKIFFQDRTRWKWLRRPKLCTNSCWAVLRKRRRITAVYGTYEITFYYINPVFWGGGYRSSKWSDTVLRYWKTKLFCIKQTSKTTGKIALWNEARHPMNSLHPRFWTHSGNTHAPLRWGTCNKNTGHQIQNLSPSKQAG